MIKGFVISVLALIGGIIDRAHFAPISQQCHSLTGLFARALSEQADTGCTLANAVAPWGTPLIVGGSIGTGVCVVMFLVMLGKASTSGS